jgi:hypothetical protein
MHMSRSLIPFLASLTLICFVETVPAQETPLELSACDLAKHPKSFDAKIIRVRGILSVHFEDFSLTAPDCDTPQGIWLAFGGDVPGIVPSTANDNSRTPGVDIKVNGVSHGIKKDEKFRRLYALIAARHGDKPAYTVTATLEGAFYAGEERLLANGQTDFSGYGHLGCCALFVITQVLDVASTPPANLNVRGTLSGPDGRPIAGFAVFDDIVGGSPPERQQAVTNEKGEFSFSDSGQLLLFEKPSYRPLALPVEPGSAPIHVKLEDAKPSDWLIPSCGQLGDSASRIGFSVLFAAPTTMDSRSNKNDDFQAYYVFPRGGEPSAAELIISTSPSPNPQQSYFVDSKSSQQRWIKDSAGTVIGIDSRSRLKDGESWRTAVFGGRDAARYVLGSGKGTDSLDGIINSACTATR